MTSDDRSGRLLLLAAAVAIFLWMIGSLLVPIALAAVFAVLLFPISHGLERHMGRWGRLAPGLTTVAAVVLVVLPLSTITARAVASISSFVGSLEPGEVSEVQSTVTSRVSRWVTELGIPTDRIRDTVTGAIQSSGQRVAEFLRGMVSSLPNAIIDIFLFVLALYFFLRDGKHLGRNLALLSPFEDEETGSLFRSIVGTVRGAILGTIAVAFVQGLLTIAAFLIFRIPGAVLFGVIAAFFSLIPMVGTIPVVGGAVIYLLVSGRVGAAIGLGLIGMLVIGTSDNLVRPWIQSIGGRLHPLMALLGIFGGLATLGPAGIFIGPVVAALVLWLIAYVAKQRHDQDTPRIELNA